MLSDVGMSTGGGLVDASWCDVRLLVLGEVNWGRNATTR